MKNNIIVFVLLFFGCMSNAYSHLYGPGEMPSENPYQKEQVIIENKDIRAFVDSDEIEEISKFVCEANYYVPENGKSKHMEYARLWAAYTGKTEMYCYLYCTSFGTKNGDVKSFYNCTYKGFRPLAYDAERESLANSKSYRCRDFI